MKVEKYNFLVRCMEGFYIFFKDGRVYSKRKKDYVSVRKDKDGYMRMNLHLPNETKTFKRAAIIAFLKYKEEVVGNNIIDHRNRIRDDDSWDNVRIVNNHISAQNTKNIKLTKEDVLQIRELYDSGVAVKDIAKMFNTGKPNITRIGKRQRWNNI